MAKHLVRARDVSINSIDLTTRTQAATLTITVADGDITAMTQDWFDRAVDIKDYQLTVTFFNDYTTGSVDGTHWDLFSANSQFSVAILPSGSTASGDNPAYSGLFVLTSYTPINGARGEPDTAEATYLGAGNLARAES